MSALELGQDNLRHRRPRPGSVRRRQPRLAPAARPDSGSEPILNATPAATARDTVDECGDPESTANGTISETWLGHYEPSDPGSLGKVMTLCLGFRNCTVNSSPGQSIGK
jgi:hypothetical protein